jgi:hypothetical protein
MGPWRRYFDRSPHAAVLASHMEEHGVRFSEFDWNKECFAADIVHFHWPNEFFTAETREQRRTVWRRLLCLAAYRAKGGVLIWTVHNLWPHDQPRHNSLQLQLFFFLLSGVIFLTRMSRELACQEHPALEKSPSRSSARSRTNLCSSRKAASRPFQRPSQFVSAVSDRYGHIRTCLLSLPQCGQLRRVKPP